MNVPHLSENRSHRSVGALAFLGGDVTPSMVKPQALLDRIEWNLQCANISPNHQFSLIMVGVDNLWVYANCRSQRDADHMLRSVAWCIVQALRVPSFDGRPPASETGVMVAHMGGDVLGVLLEEEDSVEGGARAARLIRQAILHLNPAPDLDAFSTVTLGIVDVRDGHRIHRAAQDVLRDAETAIHHARSRGRGWTCVFQPALRHSATSRLQLECDLRRAVNRGEFHLVYQPIVALDTGCLSGFEALLRWQKPDGRLVNPADFIPLAEETGLVWPLGEFVLQEACRQLSQWHCRQDITMNVNVSRRQFAEEGLLEMVPAIVRSHGLRRDSLVLEITESALLEDAASVIKIMRQLTAEGIALHLDDFGTGYSSLASLHQFPIKGIKIDRSFIVSASGRRDYAAVLQTIVMLAENLGLDVVGEGVETADQVALLQSLNCPRAQGYFFGKPVGSREAGELLTRTSFLPA